MAVAETMIFEEAKLELLREDVRRRAAKQNLEGRAAWRFFRSQPQNRTLYWYRLREAARWSRIRFFCDRMYLRSSRRTGLEISTSALGGGVAMPHWGRILLNAVSIGPGLYVFHNVTVGNDYTSGKPVIGSDVFIGAGAIVVGGIEIGDHAVIGAGSVVIDDVPAGALAVGNPARIVGQAERKMVSNRRA